MTITEEKEEEEDVGVPASQKSLPAPHQSFHGFDQLGRVIADTVFEYDFDVLNIFNLLRRRSQYLQSSATDRL